MEGNKNHQSSIVNRKLVVLGAGESGVGTAILGKQKGYEVFVSDKGIIAEKYRKVLLNNDILFEEGKHTRFTIYDFRINKCYERSFKGKNKKVCN